MFAIGVGHVATAQGFLHDFVWAYHVPLFFFASGFFALRHCDCGLGTLILRKAKALLLPYLFFSLLSFALFELLYNAPAGEVAQWLPSIVDGARSHVRMGPLWFFPCLFLVTVLYEALRRVLKKPALLAGVCAGLCIASQIFTHGAYSLPFTADGALEYVFYYAIGAWVYPAAARLFTCISEGRLSIRRQGLLVAVAAMLTAYAALVFFGKDPVPGLLLGGGFILDCTHALYIMVRTLALIAFWTLTAKAVEKVKLFGELGRDTLYLCGNEGAMKIAIPSLLAALGIDLAIENPFQSIVYSFALMVLTTKVVSPVEKRLYAATFGRLGRGAGEKHAG